MPVSLGANGGSYNYPQENDPAGWGDDATNWASAVSAALSNIGLGGTASADAVVNIISTTKGVLIPRMTTTQRNAIGSPSTSLLIYNTTTTQYELYTGSTWQSLASYISGTLTVTGAASLQSTLAVNGNTTLGDASGDTLTITGNVVSTPNGLNIDSNTLVVDATNNRVGVVTASPTVALDVTGDIKASSTIQSANGTAAAPSISFSSDSNSGFYSISDNVIGVATNGTRVGEIGVGYGGFTGNVIQVLSTTKTDTFSMSSSTFADITGLSVSITPKYSTSKILVMISVSRGVSTDSQSGVRVLRDSTAIGIGDAAGSRSRESLHFYYGGSSPTSQTNTSSTQFYDTPSTTSSITYKVQIKTDGSGTVYVNRSDLDTDNANNGRTISSITVMEVQQ